MIPAKDDETGKERKNMLTPRAVDTPIKRRTTRSKVENLREKLSLYPE